MKLSTLCYFVRDGEMLLGMKKRGFGSGKWNGYGGKVAAEESIRAAAVREAREEVGLSVRENDLTQIALLDFYFEEEFVFRCHVFTAKTWEGEPRESEEMRPQWFPIKGLPFGEMWAADRDWMPLVLSGRKIQALIRFNAEGTLVKQFDCKDAAFA